MMDFLEFEFMRNALAAGVLAGIICGIMGSLVVVNRIVFLSGGVAHAAYGGIGMALYFGWPYMAGAMGFSLAAAMVMAGVSVGARGRSDTVIGVIWAVGMALGVILTDLTPGYNADLMGYLFGSILAVSQLDILVMGGATVLIAVLAFFYYPELLALSYDEEFAGIRGAPTRVLYFIMIAMLSATVVLIIRVTGLILVIALLTIPPFIMEKRVKSLAGMMAGSSLLGALFIVAGLWLSWTFNLTSGAAVIMVGGAAFFLSLALERAILFIRKR
ncbi:conserved membrane hypothetical protein [Candidatus Desulfarcum epimagneticum]|uniref:Metal ABC transporter permease n=1 Tax=uncultured Desulfobacteraceae bacterium TaxID=218296 RepID=A0A484HF39_9BACT|nr:conserved membrane hypothetical protein [uncultured Desulfobacteraceae bacterium]